MGLDLEPIKQRLASGRSTPQDTAALVVEVERLRSAIAAFSEQQAAIEEQITMLRLGPKPRQ